jgi:hypothetical protein
LDEALGHDAKTIKWSVQPLPTGPYKSFQRRGWPSATYSDGRLAVSLGSASGEDYNSRTAETESLWIGVRDHSVKPPEYRRLVTRAQGVKAAKALAERFIAQHPEYAA